MRRNLCARSCQHHFIYYRDSYSSIGQLISLFIQFPHITSGMLISSGAVLEFFANYRYNLSGKGGAISSVSTEIKAKVVLPGLMIFNVFGSVISPGHCKFVHLRS